MLIHFPYHHYCWDIIIISGIVSSLEKQWWIDDRGHFARSLVGPLTDHYSVFNKKAVDDDDDYDDDHNNDDDDADDDDHDNVGGDASMDVA